MTGSVVVMGVIGVILIIASFFVTENRTSKESSFHMDLMTVSEDYEFSEREQNIIRRKIEEVIARTANEIVYETNDSLSNLANEKMMALGDYAVAVCDEIEKNHKEVMFLYSMLDDKQKEIMNTVKGVDEANHMIRQLMDQVNDQIESTQSSGKQTSEIEEKDSHTEHSKADLNEEKEMDLEIQNIFAEMDRGEFGIEDSKEATDENSNELILELYQKGDSIIDIAKQLGLGVGEVKLVIDLYQGE